MRLLTSEEVNITSGGYSCAELETMVLTLSAYYHSVCGYNLPETYFCAIGLEYMQELMYQWWAQGCDRQ